MPTDGNHDGNSILLQLLFKHNDVITMKMYQCVYSLGSLKSFTMSRNTLSNFDGYIVESTLAGCIMACHNNFKAQDSKTAESVYHTSLYLDNIR